MKRVFYDADGGFEFSQETQVGIVGYGIQGRAQALNLRDSGFRVLIGNRKDSYVTTAQEDGFQVLPIEEVATQADVLFLLIPDQAHALVYKDQIEPFLRQGGMLVVAHGYSLHYGEIKPRADLDVVMCAPRMPGKQIRDYYLRGSGVPAFVDVYQNVSGKALEKVLALAKAMGFTKAGVLPVSVREEAEIDLFVEQYFIPIILKAIETSFEGLVKVGYDPAPVLLELFASGELGEVLMRAAQLGLYKTFEQNASPTCQFGISLSLGEALEKNPKTMLQDVLHRIRSGAFKEALDQEGTQKYPMTAETWRVRNHSLLSQVHKEILKKIKLQ